MNVAVSGSSLNELRQRDNLIGGIAVKSTYVMNCPAVAAPNVFTVIHTYAARHLSVSRHSVGTEKSW
jgi:hypothetical protein